MTVSRDSRVAFDAHMMAIALRMAKRGLGTTAFNPSVGAVIADETTGEVIARGWTQPGGRPHAEKEALQRAGDRARGKTMYVTLEPCAHTGRMPTCADAVLTAGLSRLVCALADPNPVVSGGGFEQLRAAGVAVDVGLMADEARALTLGHILHVTQRRPFVQLKLAVSSDWLIAPGNGAPVWVTSPEARAAGHLLRAEADVIMTGISTVTVDDPQLTCRLPGLLHRSPHRLIADSHLRIPDQARVLQRHANDRPKVWIATCDSGARSPLAAFLKAEGRVSGIIDCGAVPIKLAPVLAALSAEPVRRLLVEAGPRLSRNFIENDLVDEAVIFRGFTPLGGESLEPLAGVAFPGVFQDARKWRLSDQRSIGPDQMYVYRRLRQ
jgi:diaminohydroxyphosphoribosylaminopyrimidine deaminase / 5-amino-6-(5-phosphoribosylamino)uracil reductase